MIVSVDTYELNAYIREIISETYALNVYVIECTHMSACDCNTIVHMNVFDIL